MTTPTSADPWATIAREVDRATLAECPGLLGELERLKASLWLKMATPTQKPSAQESDRLLTAKEVAERLHVTTAYIYKNAARYPFAIREGRYVRFSQQGLARYLARHQGK